MGRKSKRSNNKHNLKEVVTKNNQSGKPNTILETVDSITVNPECNENQKLLTTNNGINKDGRKTVEQTEKTDTMLSELKLIKIESSTNNNKNLNNIHRDFYINYLCQVCKKLNNAKEMCTKCGMISYCSTEHRRKHWPMHGELCAALQEICATESKIHILENGTSHYNADTFRAHCYHVMLTCEKILQRKLEQWEVEFLLFPRVCNTCYNHNMDELEFCNECHHCNYCKTNSEHLPTKHKQYCHSLKLYKKILQYQYESGIIETIFPDTSSIKTTSFESANIDSILKQSKTSLSDLEYIQLTEMATSPLTVAHCITTNDNISKSLTETFTIHVIGAEKDFELNQLQKWEVFFLHYFNKIKTLNIVFVGPEMKISNDDAAKLNNFALCENCSNQFRRINCEFYDKMLYHNYVLNQPQYIKPNFICAFNAGLYRTTGFNERDSWPETINAMFQQKRTPVLITAYTSVEILKDIKRVKELHKCQVIKMPTKNPFSSLKPNLNFVSYEDSPVIFKNYYLVLLTN